MTALLEAVDVTMTFSGLRALDGVSLGVDAGERVGLIGPNGAGKTTLFNCLTGLQRPDAGRVMLDGVNVNRWPAHRRARAGMGRTFQRAALFSDTTVREHLLIPERVRNGSGSLWRDVLGLGRPTPEEMVACDQVLESLGISKLSDKPVEALTLGQSRLVEVGRALMTGPKVLLLDEPSSGLDQHETAALAETVRTVQDSRGYGVLLVEHDVAFVAEFTTRAYVLDSGTIIAKGSTADVLADLAVRRAYLGSVAVS